MRARCQGEVADNNEWLTGTEVGPHPLSAKDRTRGKEKKTGRICIVAQALSWPRLDLLQIVKGQGIVHQCHQYGECEVGPGRGQIAPVTTRTETPGSMHRTKRRRQRAI